MKNFSLETIFSAIFGINLTDNFDNVYELAWFVYDNPRINKCGLASLKGNLRQHLLSIYPQFENISYVPKFEKNFKMWIDLQKLAYGEVLPVTKLGFELENKVMKMN